MTTPSSERENEAVADKIMRSVAEYSFNVYQAQVGNKALLLGALAIVEHLDAKDAEIDKLKGHHLVQAYEREVKENQDLRSRLSAAEKEVEMLKALFDTKDVDHKWIETFYESGWNDSDMKFTDFEKLILEELSYFLPRHMDVYDWNRPYAEAMILIIRNLLNGKKIITESAK